MCSRDRLSRSMLIGCIQGWTAMFTSCRISSLVCWLSGDAPCSGFGNFESLNGYMLWDAG